MAELATEGQIKKGKELGLDLSKLTKQEAMKVLNYYFNFEGKGHRDFLTSGELLQRGLVPGVRVKYYPTNLSFKSTIPGGAVGIIQSVYIPRQMVFVIFDPPLNPPKRTVSVHTLKVI